jgi:NADH dehydrogenase
LVLVSVIGARLDPHYKYLTSRWMGEQELAKSGVAGTILRFSLVLAEEGGVLNDFEREANFSPFLIMAGSGEAKLQPILREDVARCVVDAIGRPELLGKIIELGGPEVVTFEKKPKLKLPVPMLIPGAMAMEALFKDPIVTADEINTIQLDNIADGIDSVSTHFGWRPTSPSSWVPANWTKPARR